MVYGPFSLADATAAELTFKLWLNSELGYDGLCRLASVNGTDFYGTCTSGNTAGWVDKGLDLSNVPDLGNLIGRPNVWIAIAFSSDLDTTRAEGAYVDNILLRKFLPGGTATTPQLEVASPATTTEAVSEQSAQRVYRR